MKSCESVFRRKNIFNYKNFACTSNALSRDLERALFNHPKGIHDDRFKVVVLVVYAAEQAPPPPSVSIARTI
jgi:hypothetical protein